MKNRSIVIALVIALVASAGWWFLLYSPKNEHLAQVQTEVDGLVAQQQQLRNEITQLREVEADQVQIRAALTRLEDYIPSDPEQPSVIRHFQKSADEAGVDIASVTFGKAAPVVGAPPNADPELTLAEIPVSMVLEGSYFQVVDFFRRLEVDVPRAILVDSISMAEGEDAFPELTTTWTGQVFAEVPVVVVPVAPVEGAPPAAGTAPTEGATPAPGTSPAPQDQTTTAQDASVQAASPATTSGEQG